ncbi:MAG: hypothetical protein WCK89_13620, partial [bacterium]
DAYSSGTWSGSCVVELANGKAHTGSQSLHIRGSNGSATVWQEVSVTTQTQFIASLWVSTAALSGVGKTGLELKSNGTCYYISPDTQSNDGQWRQIHVSFNSGNATRITVICAFEMYGNGSGDAWFDDLQLAPVPTWPAISPPYSLTFGAGRQGKPGFLLNGTPFFPIANWINCSATVEELRRFKGDGFSMIILSADVGNFSDPHFRDLMLACSELRLPVVLDYAPGEFFGWVQGQPQLCMKLPDGKAVGYPDFANPATRLAFRQRLTTVFNGISTYAGNPIIALSPNDSYDSCHIPDGEVHYAFTVPPHAPGVQTLPFGASALNQYRGYLQNVLQLSPGDAGFNAWADVFLPENQSEALNELHWRSWILYRRYYMKDFLQEMADLAREQTGLPVAMSLDVNFAIDENWGTPPFEYAKPADFLILYYYQLGLEPRTRVQQLLEWVYSHCALQGKPMIGLLEVSSALPPTTSAEDYLRGSLPYLSGFALMDAVAGYQEVLSRYADFICSVAGMSGELLTAFPRKASIALLLGTRDIYLKETVSPLLQNLGVEYDILFDVDLLKRPEILNEYEMVYLPFGQPQLTHDAEISALLAETTKVLDCLYRLCPNPFLFDGFEPPALPPPYAWPHSSDNATTATVRSEAARSGACGTTWDFTYRNSGDVNFCDIAVSEQNLTGLQSIGLWCRPSGTGVKQWNIVALELLRGGGQSALMLGWWNAGDTGIQCGNWTGHEWTINGTPDLTQVQYLRLWVTGDSSWAAISGSKRGSLDLDDLTLTFRTQPPAGVPQWELY